MLTSYRHSLLLTAMALPLAMVVDGPLPSHAQEVVQALPDPANAELSDALQRLSRNPNNVRALVDAGNASLILGDVRGALGFFNRAQARRPEDRTVLAGLALVAVRRGEGAIAVQLFDNANAAGAAMSPLAAERGLAYDLVGNNARAQRLYRQALSREENDEVIRRLALSYAISGDEAASEATLLPLLQRQDRSAYRSRAFALAILGRDAEAITIAEAMLPPRLSSRLAPYLRYMPRLTRAQQAAAANLGRFPSASEIGRDTPQIAALSNEVTQPIPATNVASGDRLTPTGEALGPAQPAAAEPVPTQVAQAPVEQPPVEQPSTALTPTPTPSLAASSAAQTEPSGELPALASAQLPASTAAPATRPVVTTSVPQGPTQELPSPVEEAIAAVEEVPPPPPRARSPIVVATLGNEEAIPPPRQEVRPSFSLSEPVVQDVEETVAQGPASTDSVLAQQTIAPPPAEPVQTQEQLGLAEAFADFTLPSGGLPVAPAAGAVDITRIEPAREPEPEPEPAPPPPPVHPSRHWVQVATGQDTDAFRFDWRRIVRNADGLLDDAEAFSAPWNQTNRLFTGPFDSRREAQELITQLGEAGVDSFRFTSADGQEVFPLD